ncbi:MAG: hypothetical protein PHQ19_05195 [Candidatus Krumholzibacteria bacterium]|nr:hypothetical protein [Candidatus Krumholzibacteria bacterium]
MKRILITAAVVALIAAAGCQSQHPSVVKVEPEFNPGKISSILVVPVVSTVTQGEDPDRESERITNRVLWNLLSARNDYRFLSPEQFRIALVSADRSEEYEAFKTAWGRDHTVDSAFLRAIGSELEVDLFLIPVVYLWHKDEADYRESATASATQVGMTLSLVDPATGRVLWEATDENFKEAVRTEGDRIQSTSFGIDRRISGTTATGKDMYAAPPFEDVVVLVLDALVGAIPERAPGGS